MQNVMKCKWNAGCYEIFVSVYASPIYQAGDVCSSMTFRSGEGRLWISTSTYWSMLVSVTLGMDGIMKLCKASISRIFWCNSRVLDCPKYSRLWLSILWTKRLRGGMLFLLKFTWCSFMDICTTFEWRKFVNRTVHTPATRNCVVCSFACGKAEFTCDLRAR